MRWSLDCLFVTREGVLVLVEVKRASDTRARREVVAQMLDYAANGPAYWETDEIVRAFRGTCEEAGNDADEVLASFLPNASSDDPDGTAEKFWRQVDANLRAGKMRLLFVADEISRELRRIVEFLNEQMRPAEVLALEIAHYAAPDGTGPRTLVPRLIGNTARAESAKGVSTPLPAIDVDEWLSRLGERHDRDAERGARRMVNWFAAQQLPHDVSKAQASIYARGIGADGAPLGYPFFIQGEGATFDVALRWLWSTKPFESEDARRRLHDRLVAEVPSLRTTGKLGGYPNVALVALNDDAAWAPLTAILRDMLDELSKEPTS